MAIKMEYFVSAPAFSFFLRFEEDIIIRFNYAPSQLPVPSQMCVFGFKTKKTKIVAIRELY